MPREMILVFVPNMKRPLVSSEYEKPTKARVSRKHLFSHDIQNTFHDICGIVPQEPAPRQRSAYVLNAHVIRAVFEMAD